MFTNPATCVPMDWWLNRLGLHPLLATRTSVKPCAAQPSQEDCIIRELPSTFLDDVATAMNQATDAIRTVTGISPCLQFESEVVDYKKYTGEQYGRINGQSKDFITPMRTFDGCNWKSVKLKRNHYITGGFRATTLIASDLPVMYLDLDGDGIREVAEISYTFPTEPTFNICELWAFFEDSDGEDRYRVKSIFIERDEVGLTVTLRYPSWALFKPSVLSNSVVNQAYGLPKTKFSICCDFLPDDTIDPLDTDCPLASTVDLYRFYIDTVPCPVDLSFIGGCNCSDNACVAQLEKACIQDTNVCNYVRLVPAIEDEQTGQCEPKSCFDHCCEPEKACVHYVGGCPDCLDLDCFNPNTLCFEDALYWLTAAWTRYKPCDCGRTILADMDTAQEESAEIDEDIDNPYYRLIVRNGYVGERRAWGLLKHFIDKQCSQDIPKGIAALGGA